MTLLALMTELYVFCSDNINAIYMFLFLVDVVVPHTSCQAHVVPQSWDAAWACVSQSLSGPTTACEYTTCDTTFTIEQHMNVASCTILLGICATVILYFWYWSLEAHGNPLGNSWRSAFIDFLRSFMAQPSTKPCTLRSMFMKTPNITNYEASNHTHPVSACTRNNGASLIDAFSALVGRPAYFIQSSAADKRNGRNGCRVLYWAKDTTVDHKAFAPQADEILALVDVDMYLDIPKLLCDRFQPVIISTFQPAAAAKSDGDYSYSFNGKNEVVYTVSGGAEYTHMVWDYAADVVMAVSWRFGVCRHRTYNIDRRFLDTHHQVILFTPISQFFCPLFSLASWLKTDYIKRLKVVETMPDGKQFVRMSIQTKDGMFTSTGKVDTLLCATIPAALDHTLASQALISKNIELQTATTRMTLTTDKKEISVETAVLLTEYHRYKCGNRAPVVYPVDKSIFKFQFNPHQHDIHAKPSLEPFMNPFMLGCYAPDQCKNNDAAAIDGRVTGVKNPELVVGKDMLGYMCEFVELLIPTAHAADPVDYEVVHEQQDRPTQRRILESASQNAALIEEKTLETFGKKEAYTKITDPRNITTFPGVTKLNYSRFIYAFTNILRVTSWYAFALSPLAIANRVAAICCRAIKVVNTDLSRFDGRVSNVLRLLEHMAMMRYFKVEYHQELNELMASQQNQNARTKYGVKYNTGTSRGSGSAETADFNSMDNAFMAYVALRRTSQNGTRLTPQDAWKALGIYGGDDGITADVDASVYVKACKDVGQVLEVEEVSRGERGVTFLARFYSPEVWHGSLDSMCDIARQLSKFHTTVSLPSTIKPIQKFAEKIYSYYLTDGNTPIIGQIATAFVTTFPELVPKQLSLAGVFYKHADYGVDVQYPNVFGGWMTEEALRSIPTFDYDLLATWIKTWQATKCVKAVLEPPVMTDMNITHNTKATVVVNGEVVKPPRITLPEDYPVLPTALPKMKKVFTPEDLERMKLLPCKGFAEGKCQFAGRCRFAHVKK